jgi:hypothetical protein|nr:MAG TPA: hypothetical protein [Caudoviricetes sp.]
MPESKYKQFGDELIWGVPKDEMSLVTQTVTFTQKSDKKEVRDHEGEIRTVTYYNQSADVTIEGFGDASASVATRLTMQNTFQSAMAGALLIDQCQVSLSNEDHIKSSITAVLYPNISASASE